MQRTTAQLYYVSRLSEEALAPNCPATISRWTAGRLSATLCFACNLLKLNRGLLQRIRILGHAHEVSVCADESGGPHGSAPRHRDAALPVTWQYHAQNRTLAVLGEAPRDGKCA